MARVITARYPGICRECGSAIHVGTRIVWQRRNSKHQVCNEQDGGPDACEDCMGTGQVSSMFGGGECGCNNGRRWR